jgi:hypothetical protein
MDLLRRAERSERGAIRTRGIDRVLEDLSRREACDRGSR